jgi:hypothetical protein
MAVLDGWNPHNQTEAAQLARLDAMHTGPTEGPRNDPSRYWLATMRVEASECSEDAPILLGPETHHI